VTREQFDNILARLQEQIASHAAFTFQVIGMGKKSSEAAEKEQEKFKAKSYKAALEKLPKEQVMISPKLKWVKCRRHCKRALGAPVCTRFTMPILSFPVPPLSPLPGWPNG